MNAAAATMLQPTLDTSAAVGKVKDQLAGYEPAGFSTAEATLVACRAKPQRCDAVIMAILGRAPDRSNWRLPCTRGRHMRRSCWRRDRGEERRGQLDRRRHFGCRAMTSAHREMAAALAHGSAQRESLVRRLALLVTASPAR